LAGLFDKAIEAYFRNQLRYPNTLAASKSGVPLAQAYIAKGPEEYGKAETVLLSVVDNNPLLTPEAEEFRAALFELAQLYYRTGRFEESVTRLEEMTQRYPKDERMGQLVFLMADSYRKSAALLDGRLAAANGADPAFPLRLIGMRELRSHNTWLHNAPALMRARRPHALRIHPDDAAAARLADGDVARVASPSGELETPVLVTDEMTPGSVALPHGWGHRGGWRLANEGGGVNVNVLASSEPDDLEPLAGMSHLNGIPVRVTRAGA
jgi:anaerobic selenocysteine-containing dehydrogenase